MPEWLSKKTPYMVRIAGMADAKTFLVVIYLRMILKLNKREGGHDHRNVVTITGMGGQHHRNVVTITGLGGQHESEYTILSFV